MTKAKVAESELINSLFDTAVSFLRSSAGSAEYVERVDRERWRHVEIVLSSEPSSEPGFFKVSSEGDNTGMTLEDVMREYNGEYSVNSLNNTV